MLTSNKAASRTDKQNLIGFFSVLGLHLDCSSPVQCSHEDAVQSAGLHQVNWEGSARDESILILTTTGKRRISSREVRITCVRCFCRSRTTKTPQEAGPDVIVCSSLVAWARCYRTQKRLRIRRARRSAACSTTEREVSSNVCCKVWACERLLTPIVRYNACRLLISQNRNRSDGISRATAGCTVVLGTTEERC